MHAWYRETEYQSDWPFMELLTANRVAAHGRTETTTLDDRTTGARPTAAAHAMVVGSQPLPKEAAVFVPVDDLQEFGDGCNSHHRLISLPLQAGPPPENAPPVLRADIRCLRDRVLVDDAPIVPLGTDLQNLDALASDAIAGVEIGADMGGWPALQEEAIQRFLDSLSFQVVESHR